MKVRLDFSGIPVLCKVLNKKKEFEFEFSGHTLGELVESLVRRFGPPMTKALLDPNGDVDMEIRVVLNQGTYITEDRRKAVFLTFSPVMPQYIRKAKALNPQKHETK